LPPVDSKAPRPFEIGFDCAGCWHLALAFCFRPCKALRSSEDKKRREKKRMIFQKKEWEKKRNI
jgi:hypothetical protein